MSDLLAGSMEGWRELDGRRVRTVLDPVRLVLHFRRVGAEYNRLRSGLSVNRGMLLPVLWLALRERGWLISREAAGDAWDLASFTPLRSGGGDGDDPF
ncbi:MAG: hypothetical protein VKP63_05710 [Cyanobacteriota bacterium]|nr:hypothetical protein [Cyanobacteriota bacterium]